MLTIKNTTGLVRDTQVLDENGRDITRLMMPVTIQISIEPGGQAMATIEAPVKLEITALEPMVKAPDQENEE